MWMWLHIYALNKLNTGLVNFIRLRYVVFQLIGFGIIITLKGRVGY